jgi:hypothetical protein
VALTTNLYACVIELKEERPLRRDLERLVLAIAASVSSMSVRDEQVLELP